MTIFGECTWSKESIFEKIPITFGTVTQIQQKVYFWIDLIKTFRIIYNLFGFEEVRILLSVFGNEVIMRSFAITGLSN